MLLSREEIQDMHNHLSTSNENAFQNSLIMKESGNMTTSKNEQVSSHTVPQPHRRVLFCLKENYSYVFQVEYAEMVRNVNNYL